MRRFGTALLMVTGLAVAAAACQPEGEEAGTTDEAAEMEEKAVDGAPMEGVSVTLVPKNESGIAGTAIVRPADSDSLRVQLKLSGLTADQEYPAHVHQGTCDRGGAVQMALQSVAAVADTASSVTTVRDPRIRAADGDFMIQVHLPDGSPAACGLLPSSREAPTGNGGGG